MFLKEHYREGNSRTELEIVPGTSRVFLKEHSDQRTSRLLGVVSAFVQWLSKMFLQEHLCPSCLDEAGWIEVFLQEQFWDC